MTIQCCYWTLRIELSLRDNRAHQRESRVKGSRSWIGTREAVPQLLAREERRVWALGCYFVVLSDKRGRLQWCVWRGREARAVGTKFSNHAAKGGSRVVSGRGAPQ